MGVLKDPSDRRSSPRRPLNELPQIIGARVASETVQVINLSSGGILFDCGQRLRPGSEGQLEILMADASQRLRGRVVRCQLTALASAGPQYQVAMKFNNPLRVIEDYEASAQADTLESVADGFARAVHTAGADLPGLDSALALNSW
ncbi:MAG: PilZ domain-containing protein [Betaproteobacteria bacterium]